LNAEVPALPEPKTPKGQRITVEQAIGKLCPLKSGEKDPNDPLHYASKHLPLALERLKHIPKNGGSRFSLPAELELNCHKNHDGHGDVYGRMCWQDVAPTLTTGCTDVTRGRFAHPRDDRAITLREAAILQSFPRNYKFRGNKSQITAQIGNAVPVELVKALAPTLRIGMKRVQKFR
jgi:DNA (cytosine-5)-methyltransferase 1